VWEEVGTGHGGSISVRGERGFLYLNHQPWPLALQDVTGLGWDWDQCHTLQPISLRKA
jgi:hypothetical protein